eukprot:SAG31_NODE_13523_length_864_cov_0.806536_2_plen_77_part_01
MYPTAPFDIHEVLRDPWNMGTDVQLLSFLVDAEFISLSLCSSSMCSSDFRTCPGSHAASVGAGAYPQWTAADRTYWI